LQRRAFGLIATKRLYTLECQLLFLFINIPVIAKNPIALFGSTESFISPFLGNRCRFHPSCSQYAEEAIAQFGIVPGLIKGFARLLKCHLGILADLTQSFLKSKILSV